jgi:hypothetical protein
MSASVGYGRPVGPVVTLVVDVGCQVGLVVLLKWLRVKSKLRDLRNEKLNTMDSCIINSRKAITNDPAGKSDLEFVA